MSVNTETGRTIAELRQRLAEAEATIEAIRSGGVDAFLVQHANGGRVYTLDSADRPYRVLVENMRQGALMITAEGTVLFANRRFVELVRADPARVAGAALESWLSQAERPVLAALLDEGRTGTARGELEFERSDGSRVHTDFTVSPLRTDGTAALGAVVTDLTEQKQYEELRQAQQALGESEQRFRALFEQAPVGIVESDVASGRFIRVNPAYEALVGYSAEELRRLRKQDLMSPEESAADEAAEQAAFERGQPRYRREKRYIRKDGSSVFVDVTVTLLRDRAGRPARRLAAVIDVTERKANEALLQEADRRKDEFLATLAHELRNPLAPIRNAVEILRRQASGIAAVERPRDIIDRQLHQMTRLVDDLLDLSRITRGRVAIRRDRVPLSRIIDTAIETSQPVIGLNNHQLTVALPDRPIFLDADLTRLAQVFANLLNNAAKYTEPGGRIEVKAARDGDAVAVSVRDSGAGIPPDMLPQVFDMFTQVDRSLERAHTGLGIGLTLAQGLVELHGGTIQARSEGLGRGSEFIVRLPVASAALAPPSEVAPPGRGGTTRLSVLAVDDNQDGADSLAMVLGLEGFDVRTAYDGQAAVDLARAMDPDVILLDLGMPGMSGYEACERIRADARERRPLIIAITGWSQDVDRRRSREAGFDRHLVKPVDPRALADLLTSLAHAGNV